MTDGLEGQAGVEHTEVPAEESEETPAEEQSETPEEDTLDNSQVPVHDDSVEVLLVKETAAQLGQRLGVPVNRIRELNPDAVDGDGNITLDRVKVR